MNELITEHLLALSRLDGQLTAFVKQKDSIEGELTSLAAEIQGLRSRVAELEELHRQGTDKQSSEESQLKEEQDKIVQRRKQLTLIGGAKSAKLVERELDIASRTVQVMEERTIKALEELDGFVTELEEARSILEEKEGEFEAQSQEVEKEITQLQGNIDSLTNDRQAQISNLDDRIMKLYNRVKGRYPGDAVSEAKEGACQSCYRALPPQTYNQVLAGNHLLQCPGCSRILIAGEQALEAVK